MALLTIPGGKVSDPTPDGVRKQAEIELREEIGYRPGRLEKLLDISSHPGYIAHKVHLMVAYDLEWDPLEMEDGEEIRIHTFSLDEALAATREDCGAILKLHWPSGCIQAKNYDDLSQ